MNFNSLKYFVFLNVFIIIFLTKYLVHNVIRTKGIELVSLSQGPADGSNSQTMQVYANPDATVKDKTLPGKNGFHNNVSVRSYSSKERNLPTVAQSVLGAFDTSNNNDNRSLEKLTERDVTDNKKTVSLPAEKKNYQTIIFLKESKIESLGEYIEIYSSMCQKEVEKRNYRHRRNHANFCSCIPATLRKCNYSTGKVLSIILSVLLNSTKLILNDNENVRKQHN